MKFWEYESSVINIIFQLGILAIVLLIANMLIRKIHFIQKSLLPTSVVGGLMVLIVKSLLEIFNISIIDNQFMEAIAYHTLALGFIALALKKVGKIQEKKSVVFDTGMTVVSTYLIQGIFGLVITIPLAFFITGLIPSAGLLLPLGFGQGTGQAMSFGYRFEQYQNGLLFGENFGLSIAALGFLAACIIGVIYMNILKKQGKISRNKEVSNFISPEEISAPNEIPLTEAMDKFTIQAALVIFVYFLTFCVIYGVRILFYGLNEIPQNDEGIDSTILGLMVGFNFLIGTILAVLIKLLILNLQKIKAMKRDYPNNFLLNRISGFAFDLMIISGIAAIEIKQLQMLWVPLIILCVIGTIVTFLYLNIICKYLYPNYRYEAMVSLFGTLTGTASTGMILLREIDSTYKTPAANNLIYQNFYAVIFGFPIMLLLAFNPTDLSKALICLVITIIMFIIYNIIIFRHKIFKKKGSLENGQ